MPLDGNLLFLIALAILFSAFVKGALGLGFSTICLAILANIINIKLAIAIILLPSMASNLVVMFDAGHWKVSFTLFWTMLLTALIGMMIGLQILRQEDNSLSIALLGYALILYGCYGLYSHYKDRPFKIKNSLIPKLNPLIGITTGAINGATGSQIFPIMPYLLALDISKDILIQTINMSFTISSIVMLIALFYMGAIDTNFTLKTAIGIAPMLVGIWLGNKLRKRISEDKFKALSMVLIIILGLLLLTRN